MSIAEDYNQWAAIYDTNDNKTRDLDAFATQKVLQNIRFNNVLELGCGTGKNTQWLLKKGAKVTALDFSSKMLEKATQKIQNSNVQFVLTDLNKKWPDLPESFDLITCSLTLEHIKNLNAIFSQAAHHLAKNGRFFICELHPFKQYLGSKARFEDKENSTVLEVYKHHLSDYLNAAENNELKLIKMQEWFDEDINDIPRLISFVFKK